MRALAAFGIFTEVEEEVYEHNAFSTKLSTPPISQSAFPMAVRIRGMTQLPEYLAHISYRNPGADPSDKTLFQWSNNTDLEFFQWMQTQPKQLAAFNASMAKSVATEHASTDKGFADMYPFERELVDVSTDQVALVDVGGGYGQVLQDIREHLPGLRGKMVLEDLPETVKAAPPIENVEVVPYNFFTQQQPVKGMILLSSSSFSTVCCPMRLIRARSTRIPLTPYPP
jgi:demethylsterigmatocystin 6-O-methyltransferase